MRKKILIILLILLICGCSKESQEEEKIKELYKAPETVIINENDNIYPLFTDVYIYDLIGENNINITTPNSLVDTTNTGKFTVTLDYTYENTNYRYDLSYQVVDVTAPYVLSYQKNVYTELLNIPYPCESANYVDDYEDEPYCEIIGDYDITNEGTYNVQYRFYDSSDNETLKDLTIHVIAELPISTTKKTSTTTTKTYIDDIIKKYKTNETMIGIDISRWQGDIEFEKVKESGVEFVIMRMGIQSNYDKDISVDTYYYENIKKAKEAGLKVGVYVYTSAISEEMALEQAKWTLEVLNGESLDFPIAYDWENWSKLGSYGISIYKLSNSFNVFASYLEKNGYNAMLYSSKHYLENIWMNKENRPVWLAHYTSSKSSYEGDYILWQICNDGRVDGVKGAVDLDIYYKQKDE